MSQCGLPLRTGIVFAFVQEVYRLVEPLAGLGNVTVAKRGHCTHRRDLPTNEGKRIGLRSASREPLVCPSVHAKRVQNAQYLTPCDRGDGAGSIDERSLDMNQARNTMSI